MLRIYETMTKRKAAYQAVIGERQTPMQPSMLVNTKALKPQKDERIKQVKCLGCVG